MASTDLIQYIEAMASRAWPAQVQQQYGGWLLRANQGVTHRANSVLPIGKPPEAQLEKALKIVQSFYQHHQLPMQFQLTSASQPPQLEGTLEALGFTTDLRVQVCTTNLADVVMEEPKVGIVIFGRLNQDWLNAYGHFAGYDATALKVRRDVMERISNEKAFATAIIDEKVVGVCMGVMDADWLGIFGLIVTEQHRRRGIATSLTQSLVSWGVNRGATKAYLQVEARNSPAKALYHSLGFKETYSYWYRIEPI